MCGLGGVKRFNTSVPEKLPEVGKFFVFAESGLGRSPLGPACPHCQEAGLAAATTLPLYLLMPIESAKMVASLRENSAVEKSTCMGRIRRDTVAYRA